jgi:predicted ATPase
VLVVEDLHWADELLLDFLACVPQLRRLSTFLRQIRLGITVSWRGPPSAR